MQLLQQLTNKHKWEVNRACIYVLVSWYIIHDQVDVTKLVQSSEASDLLRNNTDDALKHGAFGVPG